VSVGKFLKALVTCGFVFGCLVERMVKDAYNYRVNDDLSCLRKLVVG